MISGEILMNINELYFKNKRNGNYIVSAKYDVEREAIALNVTSDSSRAYKNYLNYAPVAEGDLSTVADRWLDNLPVEIADNEDNTIGGVLDSKQKWLLTTNIVKDYSAIVTPVGEII